MNCKTSCVLAQVRVMYFILKNTVLTLFIISLQHLVLLFTISFKQILYPLVFTKQTTSSAVLQGDFCLKYLEITI